jgi:hypothetical protein
MMDIDAIKLHSMELENNVNQLYSQLASWNKALKKIYGTIGNDRESRIVAVVCSSRKKYTISLKPDNVRTSVKHMKKPGRGYQNNLNRSKVRKRDSNREVL